MLLDHHAVVRPTSQIERIQEVHIVELTNETSSRLIHLRKFIANGANAMILLLAIKDVPWHQENLAQSIQHLSDRNASCFTRASSRARLQGVFQKSLSHFRRCGAPDAIC